MENLIEFWSQVDTTSECWEWRGRINNWGYGKFKKKYVHRISYELVKGSIPKGLVIHHTCENKICVNPEHLELVTHGDNVRYGNKRLVYCKRGHLRTSDNTRVLARGSRVCKECRRIEAREYHRLRKS